MAHQASMNGGFRFRSRNDNVLESISELGGDIASLVELQAKLTAIDVKETIAKATLPGTTLVIAAAVLVATLPVVMIGLAFVLASALGINQGIALLITGVVFGLIAAVVGWLASGEVKKSLESFRRSSEELTRNVAWVRTIIAQSGRSLHR